MAQRIINRRDHIRSYEQLDDLLQIPGFDQSLLDELSDRLYLESLPEPAPTPEPEERPEVTEISFSDEEAGPELMQARNALGQDDLPGAIEGYTKLIQSNQSLPVVIQDLQAATELHPEDVTLWQSLGDAYLRSNQVQEALEAYVKAEKLLR